MEYTVYKWDANNGYSTKEIKSDYIPVKKRLCKQITFERDMITRESVQEWVDKVIAEHFIKVKELCKGYSYKVKDHEIQSGYHNDDFIRNKITFQVNTTYLIWNGLK